MSKLVAWSKREAKLLRLRLKFLVSTWKDFSYVVLITRSHRTCCLPAAKWLVENHDWQGGHFANFGLTQAYLEAERLGCKLYGWQRQFMISLFAFRMISWSKGKLARKRRSFF